MSELKRALLELLRENAEFRLAVAGAIGLGEVLSKLEEISAQTLENTKAIKALQEQVAQHSKVLEEHTRAIRSLQEQVAQHSKVLEEHTKAIKALQEQVAQHSRILEEHTKAIRVLQEQVAQHSKVLEEHMKVIQQLSRTLSAVGARWGVLAEEAFRDSMKGIIERIFGGRVDKWVYYDERGRVFGHPSWVEVDLVVRDSEHVLIEVKASVSKGDVYELWAVGRLYEEATGRKPRLAIVSPFVDRKGRELAEELGVELYTGYEL